MSDTAANRHIVHPTLHHFGLTTAKLEAMVDWYAKVLGMTPNHQSRAPAGSQTQPGLRAAWVTNDRANHRLAIMALPGLKDSVTVNISTSRVKQLPQQRLPRSAASRAPFVQILGGAPPHPFSP